MEKLMLIGRTGCGKTTLSQTMQGIAPIYRKTQAVSYLSWIIDTPGEFLENRRLYSALSASSSACRIIGFVQDATAVASCFPPKFASMFNKQTIGIVSKIDLPTADPERAEIFLHRAGAAEIFRTSAFAPGGVDTLMTRLIFEGIVPQASNRRPGSFASSTRPLQGA
jgi:ethanolamine utilization protein EutP